jgi:serine/threonine protein kinase
MRDAEASDRREVYLRAQALVSRVYALPEGERDAYVDQETTTDPQLRDEVRWLLEALAAPDDDFLETPATASVPDEETDLKVPAPRNYTLIRPLGEGGMGVVYLAERVEGELKQVVALKLLNLAAMLNPAVANRFLTERQLLAKLNHPNIARLIDAGALADGRPFLAMEYVEGTELDRYCETARLDIKARIQLFIKICQAVQYAHQHLIIHRDLKPANVLVTGDGEPKLVDFGIARLWSDKGAVATQTMGAERIMTLAYASPEQLAGKPLSTMTDVYSLGIMLYELLAGERPWGTATEPLALAREIGQSEPMPPSVRRRLTQGRQEAAKRRLTGLRWRLPNELPRDLDAIVLKALRLNPEERYDSALSLADDLGRFLANRPVKALQGHTWYRTRKYLRRNWVPLTVTATIVAMTAGYIVDRQIQLDKTERERAKVQQVRDFLIGLFKEVQPAYTQGQNISAKEMLDRGAKRLETAPPEDPTTRLVLNSTMGETYASLGDVKSALSFTDRAIEQARAMPDLDSETLAATLLTAMGARSLNRGAQSAKLIAEEVLALSKTGKKVDPETQATALSWLAHTLGKEGRPLSETEPLHKQGIELLERKRPNSPMLVYNKMNYAQHLLDDSVRDEDALRVLRETAADAARVLGPSHPDTHNASGAYGQALYQKNRIAEAQAVLKDALESQQRILGEDHFATGVTRARLAFVLQAQERWEEAQPLLDQQMALTRRLHKYESQSTIAGLLNTTFGLRHLARHRESELLLREALALVKSAIAEEYRAVWEGVVSARLAQTLQAAGRPEEARKYAEKALLLMNADKAFKSFQANAWHALGAVAEHEGKFDEAESNYRKAFELAPTSKPLPFVLGSLLTKRGKFPEAEQAMLPAYQRFEKQMPASAPILVRTRGLLFDLYAAWGKPAQAALYRSSSGTPSATKTAR